MRTSTLSVLFATVALAGGASAGEPYRWSVMNLNGDSALGSIAWDVDDSTAVGQAAWDGQYTAAKWVAGSGQPQALASPPGFARALGVHSGSIVGFTGFAISRAVVWTGGTLTDLNPADGLDSTANAVWHSNQVGSVFRAGSNHAALWAGSAGSFVDLHPLGAADSGISDIDGSGQAGTVYWTQPGAMHAALWHGTADSVVDLHPAGAYASQAQAISNGRQGGYAQFVRDGPSHAALWSATAESFFDLTPSGGPTVAGAIYGMDGDVQVGQAGFLDGSGGATVWFGTPESAFFLGSLLSADYTETWAYAVDIDKFGTIRVVGYAYNNNYYLPDGTYYPRNEAMMWVLVPEPSSLAALAAGLAGLAALRPRRRR